MWGPFYACEECGYEFSPLVVKPNRPQPQGQPAFAGSFRLNEDDGSERLLHAACQAREPERRPSDNPHGDTIPGAAPVPERRQATSLGSYCTVPALGT